MTNTKEKMTLRPLADRVMVQRKEAEETLKGGIILPDSAKQKQETAVVVAVGPGKADKEGKIVPMPVKEGDTVLMDKYSGQEVSLNDEDYLILRAGDIIAIVE